jgi:heme exporter protein B
MLKSSIALFLKDIYSELRTRYAINALVMFIIVTISVILFSIGNERISDFLTGGLFWVVIFFSAMSGLSRGFVSEEERGTVMTLQLTAKPSVVFTGKLLFNLILGFSMNILIALLYAIIFDTFKISSLGIFVFIFILGNIGLAVSSTLIAAIISKANSKGTLYPVLSFPILLPLMMILVDLTKSCMTGVVLQEVMVEVAILVCYDIIMLAASYLLFEFIWKY